MVFAYGALVMLERAEQTTNKEVWGRCRRSFSFWGRRHSFTEVSTADDDLILELARMYRLAEAKVKAQQTDDECARDAEDQQRKDDLEEGYEC